MPLPGPPTDVRPKSKMPRPSRKKSRFSGNCRTNRVRLTCCSSTSTCAKSVFNVTSAVRFAVSPYFVSSPNWRSGSLITAGVRILSVVTRPMPYGLSSRFLLAGGRSRPIERRRARHAENAVRSAGGRGHGGQVRPLVLAADRAPQLNAPFLVLARVVADRLERDRQFRGPPALEAAGSHLPDGIPVDVRVAFVGDRLIGEAAERIGVEVVAVAPIVERIEQHAERVVLPQLIGVAPDLVRRPLVRRRRVVALPGHVDEVLVEHDPRFGPFGRRLAFSGKRLNEAGQRLGRLIDRLVEFAVDAERLGQSNRADDDAAVLAARNHFRRDRRRRVLIGDHCRRAARRLREGAGYGEPGHPNGDRDCSSDAGKRVARKWQRASGRTLES